MSTQIDRLEVEISSNSGGAAAGIDALTASLGKLKQNGTIGVAVKNLNNLTTALKGMTSVASNASKISSLADSMTKLKSVGSTGTGVKKLAESLQSLKSVDFTVISRIADSGSTFERVASSLGHLSAVKSGGLATMVNALAKLDQVTDSLDDGSITRFAERVEKLNTVLGPLATKCTSIKEAFRGININAKTAAGGVKTLHTEVKVGVLNMSNLIIVMQGVISALRPLINLLSSTISDAMEWDGIAARFGRGFGDQAEEVYTWVQRLNKEMGINVQQFMQYSSTYATMLTGFGVGMKDATQMALGYTELTYDIWAGYNDIYKNFSDAADAVRSAIAGEVEPIRRAGFTIVESTLEQTAANYGLEISLENATEAQKSYLRYLTLVDQAHAQNLVGTYAKELNTAEGVMRTFAQQLKTLAQTFGSVFLPILVKVMPWLSAFVELLGEAIIAVANFFGVEIQKVDWGSSGGVGGGLDNIGDAADGATGSLDDTAGAIKDTTDALKDLKKATIGIDELNVISPPTPSSANGGGAGGDGWGGAGSDGVLGDLGVGSLWDEAIFDMIGDQVDKIKQKIKEWLPVIELVGGALAGLGIANLLTDLGNALSKMNLLQKLFATVAIVTIEAALVFTFADKYLESGNFLYLIGEALVTAAAGYLLFKTWGVGGAVLGLSVSILAQIAAITMNLADGTIKLSSPELWTQALVTVLTGALGGAIISKHTAFSARQGLVIGLATTLSLTMMGINYGAIESGEIDTNSFESWLMQAVSVAGAGMTGFTVGKAIAGTASGGKTGLLIGITVGLVLNLASVVGAKGDDFGDNISDWLNGIITTVTTAFTAVKLWNIAGPAIKAALSSLVGKIGGWLTAGGAAALFAKIEAVLAAIPVWGWIAAAVVALLTAAIALAITDRDFTDIGHKLGEALGKGCRAVVDFAAKIGKPIWDGLCAAFDWCKEHITWDNIKSFLAMVFKKETWTEIIWPKVKEIGKAIWDGLWGGIKEGAKNLWGNITEFVDGFIQGFKDGFEIHSPSKKMISIGKEILAGLLQPLSLTGLRDKIKSMWETAKSWWNGKKDLEIAKVGVSLVKNGWSTVKGWIGKIPGVSQAVSLIKSGWSSVKKWVGSIPKVSQAVGLVKSGWSSVKSWIGSMPSLSAKIKLAKSGWSTVKKWLGNLDFKLNFKLPKIGVKWGSKEVMGFKISYPSSFYTYAKGGFPDIGEMFIAREAGPEMVGKIGNKATVANNDQIVEGISEGVYAAVLAAMKASEGNNSQSVNVYLDGKQITSVVEQRQHERGASIMGNQVYAY